MPSGTRDCQNEAHAHTQGQSDARGYRLADVASYTGEFDDETFFTTVRKFPAVWVTVGGSKPQGDASAADLVGINLRY